MRSDNNVAFATGSLAGLSTLSAARPARDFGLPGAYFSSSLFPLSLNADYTPPAEAQARSSVYVLKI
jgi:hypothetical protein